MATIDLPPSTMEARHSSIQNCGVFSLTSSMVTLLSRVLGTALCDVVIVFSLKNGSAKVTRRSHTIATDSDYRLGMNETELQQRIDSFTSEARRCTHSEMRTAASRMASMSSSRSSGVLVHCTRSVPTSSSASSSAVLRASVIVDGGRPITYAELRMISQSVEYNNELE